MIYMGDLGITYQALDLLLWLYFDAGIARSLLTRCYYYPVDVIDMVVNRVNCNKHKSNPAPICQIMDIGIIVDSMRTCCGIDR